MGQKPQQAAGPHVTEIQTVRVTLTWCWQPNSSLQEQQVDIVTDLSPPFSCCHRHFVYFSLLHIIIIGVRLVHWILGKQSSNVLIKS